MVTMTLINDATNNLADNDDVRQGKIVKKYITKRKKYDEGTNELLVYLISLPEIGELAYMLPSFVFCRCSKNVIGVRKLKFFLLLRL